LISALDIVSQLDEEAIKGLLSGLTPNQIEGLLNSWPFWAREEQRPPEDDWTTWIFLGGRGAGKTRSGAEWTKDVVLKHPGIRMALVGPTAADVRDTMIHGQSGLLSLHWDEGTRPRHTPSNRCVYWPNGSVAHTFSAEEPERLRGPNFHIAWVDELAAWRYIDDTWDMLQFALRLEYPGYSTPRVYISTTPRPLKLLKDLIEDKGTKVTRGSTYRNKANLSKKFFETIVSRYEGSTLGRQEIYGELIDDLQGALWKRSTIDASRQRGSDPPCQRIVIAVDPAASDKATAKECGIIAVGLGEDDRGYILGDFTTHAMDPAKWGKKVILAYHQLDADCVVVEGNLGGGLVETVLKQIDGTVPIKFVQARRGKYLRAEPVAMLYEQGKVSHVGFFTELEDQMCRMTALFDKENPGLSPDRVDALVWGLTYLMLESGYDSSMGWVQ